MRRGSVRLALAGLAALYVTLALLSARHKSAVFDEPAHVLGGYAYWTAGDFTLQPANGNLPQRLLALPLLWEDVALPDPGEKGWRDSNVWSLARMFLFGPGRDAVALLAQARGVNVLLGALLCLLIASTAGRLGGPRAALLAGLLAALSPTLLAHGRLATSDLCAALFFLWAFVRLALLCRKVTLRRVLLAGIAAAGLFLAKFSALVYLPLGLGLVGLRLLTRRPLPVRLGSRRFLAAGFAARGATLLAAFGLHLLLVVAGIWLAYGLRYEARSPERPGTDTFLEYASVAEVSAAAPRLGPLVRALAERRLLPEAYLYGLAHVEALGKARRAFFRGEYSATGWRLFFPYVALVKAAWPLLILAALGLFALRRGGGWLRLALALLLVGYGVLALQSTLNIGHRHILPLYPPLLVIAGQAVRVLARGTVGRAALALLLLGMGGETLRAHPHYLAYFQPLVKREQAYRLVVDSNLDWGQDLPGLRQWFARHPGERDGAVLGYFGEAEPAAYGLPLRRLVGRSPASILAPLGPGTYALSATLLQGLSTAVTGPWNPRFEARWQAARRARQRLREMPAARRQELLEGRDRATYEDLFWFAQLRAARLAAWLRPRAPDDHVGYSILIFRLSAADLRQALDEPLAPQADAPVFDDAEWHRLRDHRFTE